MELNRFKPIAFSFMVSLAIAFVFLMATFYILAYSGPDAMSDALGTTGSYFGATATLGASIIAAYLFNDWRDVQSGANRSEHARVILRDLFHLQVVLDHYLNEVYTIATHYNPNKISTYQELKEEFNNKYSEIYTEFSINSSYYESVYNENISTLKAEDGINDFNSYLFAINGALSRIMNSNPSSNEADVCYYLEHAEKIKNNFNSKTVAGINEKLSPYIVLNSKAD